MADDSLWNSHARMSRIFRRARAVAVTAGTVSAVGWLWPSMAVGAAGAVVAAFAITIGMFSWFRADDLAHRPPAR